MAWVDISAGETGGIARGKINQLGQESDLPLSMTPVLSGAHPSDQGPIALDTNHQVLFGDTLGVNIINITGDVTLDAAGAMTCVTTGTYLVLFNATYGRTSPSGVARMNVRALVDSVQLGGSGDQWSGTNNDRLTKSSTFILPLTAGEVATIEIIRDSGDSGANDGGLFSNSVAAAGWNDVPSAIMTLYKIVKA